MFKEACDGLPWSLILLVQLYWIGSDCLNLHKFRFWPSLGSFGFDGTPEGEKDDFATDKPMGHNRTLSPSYLPDAPWFPLEKYQNSEVVRTFTQH